MKAGKFLMGSPQNETDRSDREGPQHPVEITRPFYLGFYPVTKGQFAAFVKQEGYRTDAEKNGDKQTWQKPGFAAYDQSDDDPVVWVTWHDAVQFCEWLSQKENKTYGLPTEVEWEYACRAGTTTAYSFGDDAKLLRDYAWYADNANGRTHAVGGKKPNPWGLYDMHGNVMQWCADRYSGYREGSVQDPKDPLGDASHVRRGGSWDAKPRACRSAYRVGEAPDVRAATIGFRVVLRPDGG